VFDLLAGLVADDGGGFGDGERFGPGQAVCLAGVSVRSASVVAATAAMSSASMKASAPSPVGTTMAPSIGLRTSR